MPKKESLRSKTQRAIQIYNKLNILYPNIGTFLTHDSPFQLLIAVILSAQCTDERVNMVTPTLFQSFPTSKALAAANHEDVFECIKSINFCNNKTSNIIKTAIILERDYHGEVPASLETLVQLPGVGRKTANVVLGQAFGIPGITVDTHVKRLSQRLGFTKEDDAVKAEYDLMKIWPEDTWNDLSSTLIVHGRQICKARKADCAHCALYELCPSAS